MTNWGWRIPLLFGCLIIPLLFFLRRSLAETDEFIARKHRPSPGLIVKGLFANWKLVALGIMLVTANTVFYYMITAYTPTFGSSILHLAADKSLLVTMCVGASNFFWIPVMGAVSDRVGRFKLLVAPMALAILTAYPALTWLVHSPSFARLLAVELWFSFLFGTYNGAVVVFLTEIMPNEVRTSGFAFAYSCATALFGGFTPAICTYLIHVTADRAAPGLWLSFAAICGGAASLLLTPERVARITVGLGMERSVSSRLDVS
jgi:MFS family permease